MRKPRLKKVSCERRVEAAISCSFYPLAPMAVIRIIWAPGPRARPGSCRLWQGRSQSQCHPGWLSCTLWSAAHVVIFIKSGGYTSPVAFLIPQWALERARRGKINITGQHSGQRASYLFFSWEYNFHVFWHFLTLEKERHKAKYLFLAISQNWQMSLCVAVIYSYFHEKLLWNIHKMW